MNTKRKTETVRCPGCGKKFPVTGPDGLYWCSACGCYFDADPDEGGDFHNDPTRRAEREDDRTAGRVQKRRTL